MTEGAIKLDSFWAALGVALVASAASVVIQVIIGANDDDTYTLSVIRRLARRSGERVETDRSGIVFLEIDGLALPVLQRAMRDGNASTMARWLAEDTHKLAEWELDLSSQTGASQAGILLGSNEDISAFRWVEKETGTLMTCSAPDDCAEIERRHSTGVGLLGNGGASRGNLLGRGRPPDPDGEQARGREAGESRLSRRKCRLQRHACTRALLLGSGP